MYSFIPVTHESIRFGRISVPVFARKIFRFLVHKTREHVTLESIVLRNFGEDRLESELKIYITDRYYHTQTRLCIDAYLTRLL